MPKTLNLTATELMRNAGWAGDGKQIGQGPEEITFPGPGHCSYRSIGLVVIP